MTLVSSFFSWMILFSVACCTHPSDRLDSLMAHHRFREAKELLAVAMAEDGLDLFCTAQVIVRCIDLRNYKFRLGSKMLNGFQPRDFSYVSVAFAVQEMAMQEANDILGILLPVALHKKPIMTRAFNAAVFHSDYRLMKQFNDMNEEHDHGLFGSDDEGLTPLMTAIKFRRRAPFQWLLINGAANINYINSRGENLLHILARTVISDRILNSFILKLILEEDLDWKLVNNNGFTPLDIAEAKENYEIVSLLLMAKGEEEKLRN